MNLKVEILALAIRIFNEKTGNAHKPDAFESILTNILGLETQEERAARTIVETSEKIVGAVKRGNTNRKFNKIVENI